MYVRETLNYIKRYKKISTDGLNAIEKTLRLLNNSINVSDFDGRFLYKVIVDFIIKNLSKTFEKKYVKSTPIEERKILAVGMLVSNYFEWDSRILKAFQEALTDANFHTEAAVIDIWVSDIYDNRNRHYFSNYLQICENLVKLDGMQLVLIDSRTIARQSYINLIKIAIKNNINVIKKLTEWNIDLNTHEIENLYYWIVDENICQHRSDSLETARNLLLDQKVSPDKIKEITTKN